MNHYQIVVIAVLFFQFLFMLVRLFKGNPNLTTGQLIAVLMIIAALAAIEPYCLVKGGFF